jgi:hypothetical protein
MAMLFLPFFVSSCPKSSELYHKLRGWGGGWTRLGGASLASYVEEAVASLFLTIDRSFSRFD